jgi:phage shock protein E
METIKIFYKPCPEPDFKKFEEDGGIIVDVRNSSEYVAGHIPGAINIPLENLVNNLPMIPNKNQPLMICCATGMKSASATILLESLGYSHVCNGGSWSNLLEKIYLYAPL